MLKRSTNTQTVMVESRLELHQLLVGKKIIDFLTLQTCSARFNDSDAGAAAGQQGHSTCCMADRGSLHSTCR